VRSTVTWRRPGHKNRPEAVCDLVRAGLLKEPKTDNGASPCVAALIYVYDYGTRQLSKELLRDHHHHADMSVAVLHVHLDERGCLEVSLLKGQKSQVEQLASHLIGQRGVRYGRLVIIPAAVEVDP
jgi:CopG family nickel-responsive transcriptional regulator